MLKEIRFDHRTLQLPIIQGGMGVGVSLSSLAGHVMKEGAMGVISAAHPGYRRPDFRKDSIAANCAAIHEECARARAISEGNGLLGINIMVASTDYDTYVRAAIDAGVDAIISGAGLPLHLPKLTKDSDVLLAPIVSSARAAHLILRTWDKHYQTCPDFIVVEGSEAGGHLGFSREELEEGRCQPLDAIVREVLGLLAPYENATRRRSVCLRPAASLMETTSPACCGWGRTACRWRPVLSPRMNATPQIHSNRPYCSARKKTSV